MLNFLMFFYKHVGNAPLIPTYLFCMNLFTVGWVKLCQGFFPISVTHIVPVGWVKSLAAYPAKTSMTSNFDKPKPVEDIVLAVS